MSLLQRFRYWRAGWKEDLFHKWTLWMARRGSAEFIPRRQSRGWNRPEGRLERYLDRYILFKSPWFSVNLHHFHASDPDVPHDHPWHNITFLLSVIFIRKIWRNSATRPSFTDSRCSTGPLGLSSCNSAGVAPGGSWTVSAATGHRRRSSSRSTTSRPSRRTRRSAMAFSRKRPTLAMDTTSETC